jgi:hypothetical protein
MRDARGKIRDTNPGGGSLGEHRPHLRPMHREHPDVQPALLQLDQLVDETLVRGARELVDDVADAGAETSGHSALMRLGFETRPEI